LSTLKDRHARTDGAQISFRFRGKAGRIHEAGLRDRRLATIVRRCRDLPGQELLQYVDADGRVRDVRSDDVNDYIREAAASEEFSAKDFRTWAGTVLAFRALAATGHVAPAMRAVAAQLGNTPAVVRSAYVHPAVIEADLEADLDTGIRRAILRAAEVDPGEPHPPEPHEERAVLRLLDRVAAEAGSAKPARDSQCRGRGSAAARKPRPGIVTRPR
jgi:DNA topoisomerase-1